MKRIKLMAAAAMIAAVATAGYMGYTAYEYATMTPQERLILANIEALTRSEPTDPNLVPNRYITVTPYVTDIVCNTNGSITVAGEKFSGSYEKGKTYTVLYQIKNCDGVQEGAYCDQNEVGITLV